MFFKTLASCFMRPLSLTFVLLATGLALLWFTRRQRAGRILVTVSFGLPLISSYSPLPVGLLGPLETKYEPLFPVTRAQAALQESAAPRWIVVLGGGHAVDRRFPPSTQLSPAALSRLVEGIRLQRQLPGAKLLLSGGLGQAELLEETAETLGLARADMVIDPRALNTEEEARNITPRVGNESFVLVTSAFHMPRALRLFRNQGADPIPAPCNYFTLDSPGLDVWDFFPGPGNLSRTDLAMHEYLGMLWSKLRGRL